MLKCLIDDHPMSSHFSQFVFEYLVHGEGAPALHVPHAALAALEQVDPSLAASWSSVLRLSSADELAATGLTYADFLNAGASYGEDEDLPLNLRRRVTLETVGDAIVAGVRRRLLDARRLSFAALRRGFTSLEDFSLQVALELAFKPCFELATPSAAARCGCDARTLSHLRLSSTLGFYSSPRCRARCCKPHSSAAPTSRRASSSSASYCPPPRSRSETQVPQPEPKTWPSP
jgi:hypothetical protein